jgi:hypothetical protein
MRRKRAQLMGGISGKLPLCGKGAVEPFKHPVEGLA